MKTTLFSLLVIAMTAIAAGGCSAPRRAASAPVADSADDAMPLFPVTTRGEAADLSGHWYIRSVGTINVSGYEDAEQWPFLEFVPVEGRFYGSNGCNIINGSYHVGADHALTLGNISSTMRMCQGDSLEFPIARALEATASCRVASSHGVTVLNLIDSSGRVVMSLKKNDIDFISGAWKVADVNGAPMEAPDARLVIDVAEGTLHGNAGCNMVNGSLNREPRGGASVQFSNLATTRMACPYLSAESALLIALEEVWSARRASGGSVDLLDKAGKAIIHLTPLSKDDF